MKTELEGSLIRPKGGGTDGVCEGIMSRAAHSAHSKSMFYGYIRALLRLKTAHKLRPVYHALIFKSGQGRAKGGGTVKPLSLTRPLQHK